MLAYAAIRIAIWCFRIFRYDTTAYDSIRYAHPVDDDGVDEDGEDDGVDEVGLRGKKGGREKEDQVLLVLGSGG
eukprot:1611881-Rhodomonas_salina.2